MQKKLLILSTITVLAVTLSLTMKDLRKQRRNHQRRQKNLVHRLKAKAMLGQG